MKFCLQTNFGSICRRFIIKSCVALVIKCYAQHVIQSIINGTSSPQLGGQIKSGRASTGLIDTMSGLWD